MQTSEEAVDSVFQLAISLELNNRQVDIICNALSMHWRALCAGGGLHSLMGEALAKEARVEISEILTELGKCPDYFGNQPDGSLKW